MEYSDNDAYTPKQIAARVEKAGVGKSTQDPWVTLVLSVLAGAFIALAAALYVWVIHDSTLGVGMTRWVGGLAFSLGLVLVIVAGAELFTGNNLLTMAFVSGKISPRALLRNWALVWTGNLLGAFMVVALMALSGLWHSGGTALALKMVTLANAKVSLSFVEAFTRGVLCNILVCLAVWLCFSCHTTGDKVLAIILPVSGFVALGFEHSIANMYFIPAALLLREDVGLAQAAAALDLSHLTWAGFILKNLLPVTLGNVVGGGGLVGLTYWFVYLRPEKRKAAP